MSNFDAQLIADKVVEKLGESMYKLPDEFKSKIRKNYILPVVSIPCENPADFFYIEIYVSSTGGLLWRIKDPFGTQLMERAFT